jgi:hypothetical protein
MEQLLSSAESSVLGPKKYILEQKLKNIIRKNRLNLISNKITISFLIFF